ncbi:MAG: hypothetical protein SCH70_10940 [Candidatus Methanoperedens sp.]|nr:hypothetical protein [Candidatus Methanoperedens sp.]
MVKVPTGAGAGTVPSARKLLQRLQNEGIKAEDFDTVILTRTSTILVEIPML